MNSSVLLAALALAGAAPDPLPPIDECAGDPSFVVFREMLAGIVRQRDAGKLLELIDPGVQVDFGIDGSGTKAFVAAWKLDQPHQSSVWSEIGSLLQLGCTADGDTVLMPSFFEQAPPGIDPLEAYLAIVPGSAMRVDPREDSPIVARLEWDVLKLEQVSANNQWYLMRLGDGRRGHVRREQVRNLLDYRLVANKIDGRWRITALVAGD